MRRRNGSRRSSATAKSRSTAFIDHRQSRWKGGRVVATGESVYSRRFEERRRIEEDSGRSKKSKLEANSLRPSTFDLRPSTFDLRCHVASILLRFFSRLRNLRP